MNEQPAQRHSWLTSFVRSTPMSFMALTVSLTEGTTATRLLSLSSGWSNQAQTDDFWLCFWVSKLSGHHRYQFSASFHGRCQFCQLLSWLIDWVKHQPERSWSSGDSPSPITLKRQPLIWSITLVFAFRRRPTILVVSPSPTFRSESSWNLLKKSWSISSQKLS